MKKRANPDSEANIRRIDTKPKAKKQTHGFQVHLLRGAASVTKLFSDSMYGGKEGARRAARKFRRTALGEMPQRGARTLASAMTRQRAVAKRAKKRSR